SSDYLEYKLFAAMTIGPPRRICKIPRLGLEMMRSSYMSTLKNESIPANDRVRDDLKEVHDRHEITLDAARPEAVARRRKTRQRTARENIEDICDPGTFVEYGPLVIAAQRRRRTIEDLVKNTPADGMVVGLGSVNGDKFPMEKSRAVLM